MRENGIIMTIAEVKMRIKTIRTTYSAEVRKINSSMKSGASTDDLYTPTCGWFKIADGFLRNTVILREMHDNLASQVSSNDGVSEDLPSTSEHSPARTTQANSEKIGVIPRVTQIPKRKKIIQKSDPATTAVEKLENICKTSADALQEDEFEIYGRYIASQLRSMDLERAIDVQNQINKISSKSRIKDIKCKKSLHNTFSISHPKKSLVDINSPPPSNQTEVEVYSEEDSDITFIEKPGYSSDILSQALNSIFRYTDL
ncbi:uncharacterized protein LOC126734839 [Anthonomus grandis grandis]|uniref:uncharacterized protein LOC126734839 n=1 Tax=Anthonomus grandis grandis TaxID=2921223 RepID=UPI0021657C59|nr:uncharacterized protein LOC126734839 [Anthonomus grandis grandis]